MLRYVKKYLVLYYLGSLVPAVLYLGTVYVTSGAQAFLSWWTWLAALIVVFSCTVISSRVMTRAASAEVKQLIKIFYEACDPHLFLERSASVAKHIRAPFNEWGSLFMSAYGLAYLDVGEQQKASEVIDAMRRSAQAAKKPAERAHICLNMHAPIKMLYGVDLALQCINEAETVLINEASEEDYHEAKDYIGQERSFDVAEKVGDDQEIVRLYEIVQSNEHIFCRMRVMAAFHKAHAYRHLEEEDNERMALEFVLKKGNKLSVVEKARERLAEMVPLSRVSLSGAEESFSSAAVE